MIANRASPAFVGREEEVNFLLRHTATGSGLVLVEGSAGQGKTRLLGEFSADLDERKVGWRATRFQDTVPAAALEGLLAALFQAGRDRRAALLAALHYQDGARAGQANVARPAAFIDLAEEVEASLAGQQFFLILDDLQWADPATLLFLHALLDQHVAGLHVVGGLREPERRNQTRELSALRRRADVLRLRGISAQATAQLFESIAGPIREDESAFLHDLTLGNPLFVKELASHLAGTGLLEQMTLREAISRESVPRSLAEILDLVVGSLPATTLLALQAAACIGQRFDAVVLREVVELDEETLEDAIADALDRRLIRRGSGPEVTEYEFAHPLYREAVLQRGTSSLRRSVNRSLALLGEASPALFSLQELGSYAARGLYGLEAGRAIAHCARAAEDAGARQAFEVEAQFWSLALAKTPARDAGARADLYERLAAAHRAAGSWNQARASALKARAAHLQTENAEGAARTALFIAEIERFRLRLDECERWCQTVLGQVPVSDRLALRARALLGGSQVVGGRRDAGMAVLNQALDDADGVVPPDLAFWASLGLSSSGRPDEARRVSEAGLSGALAADDKTYTALLAGGLTFSALNNLERTQAELYVALLRELPPPFDMPALVRLRFAQAILAAYSGDWLEVAGLSRRWAREVRLAGRFQVAGAGIFLAESLSVHGEHAEALKTIDAAIPDLEKERPLGLLYKARLLLRAGDREGARAISEEVAPRIVDGAGASGTRLVLADVVGEVGPPSLAERLAAQLTAEPRPMMIIFIPISRQRVLGKLYAALGDYRLAFSCFEQARLVLSAGGARHELAQTCLDYAAARSKRGKRGDRDRSLALIAEADGVLAGLGLPTPVHTADPEHATLNFYITHRELEVLKHVAEGLSNQEIAAEMRITHYTVARHLESIFAKTRTANRAEAAALAVSQGLISGQPVAG